MDRDECLVWYALDLFASNPRNKAPYAMDHLNKCTLAEAMEIEITEKVIYDDHPLPNTYISAHLRCPHSWSGIFEWSLTGYADTMRDISEALFEQIGQS